MNTQLQTQSQGTSGACSMPIRSGLLQRKCACGGTPGPDGECAECRRKRLGRQRHDSAQTRPPHVPSVVHEVLRSPGQPLDPATRAFMEPRFGHDFSRVRVHTDARAAESARAVNALAYTVGRDVVFAAGQYAPETGSGRRLLVHELTHVLQQAQVPVGDISHIGLGAVDTAHEHEAAASQQLAAAESPARGLHSVSRVTTPLLQRQAPQSDVGNVFLRLREDGRVEFIYGTPKLPVTGPLGVGFRCQNGRCSFVGSSDPGNLGNQTYTLDEALGLLRGAGGTSSTATPGSSCSSDRRTPFGTCCPTGQVWMGTHCGPFQLPTPGSITNPFPLPGQPGVSLGQQPSPGLPPAGLHTPTPGLPPVGLHTPLRLHVSPLMARALGSLTLDRFALNSATLTSEHRTSLTELARTINDLLQNYPGGTVQITGHTDATGGEQLNQQLGADRAEAAKAALVAAGVPAAIISTESVGAQALRVQTQQAEARNRYVRISFEPESRLRFQGLEIRPRLTF